MIASQRAPSAWRWSRGRWPHSRSMNSSAASGSPRSSIARRSLRISERMRQRMQLQAAVARHLQHAQHLDRLGVEIAARRRQQLALGQHEAGFQQRRVGFRLRPPAAPRAARRMRRFQHAGQPRRPRARSGNSGA